VIAAFAIGRGPRAGCLPFRKLLLKNATVRFFAGLPVSAEAHRQAGRRSHGPLRQAGCGTRRAPVPPSDIAAAHEAMEEGH